MIEERTGRKKVVLVLETKTVGALSSTFWLFSHLSHSNAKSRYLSEQTLPDFLERLSHLSGFGSWDFLKKTI